MRKLIEKIGIWSAGWCVAARRPRLNLQPSTLNPQHGFTLIEVNLAIFIMAGGVLAMISLYSLGFRESRQSREDVAAAVCADAVLNPLVIALSSTNVTWSSWKSMSGFSSVSKGIKAGTGGGAIYVNPANGWHAYFKTYGKGKDTKYRVTSNPKTTADGVFRDIRSSGDGSGLPSAPKVPQGMTYALVASRESEQSPVITLAVRCVRENLLNTLMAQPVFATEVHFQGNPDR